MDDGEVMVLFDVISLFPCVAIYLAVQVYKEALESDSTLAERTPIYVPVLARLTVVSVRYVLV